MKLSIVIVEYHSVDEIKHYVEGIMAVRPDVEILISSNSQYDEETRDRLVKDFPECRWVFNERNGGFAYAMNQGLAVAQGDFLVISNPDCIICKGLDDMADFLSRHSEVGAIAPQIVDDSNAIQDSCRSYVTLQSYIWRQIRRVILHKESVLNPRFDYSRIQTVDWVIGAFIMVPREVYRKTGGLCDDYFMYAEDLDWCTRIRKAGYEIVYYPEAKIVYKGTRSARTSFKYMKIFLKSHFLYWHRFGFISIKPKRKQLVFNE